MIRYQQVDECGWKPEDKTDEKVYPLFAIVFYGIIPTKSFVNFYLLIGRNLSSFIKYQLTVSHILYFLCVP